MAYKHGVYAEQKGYSGAIPQRAIGTVPAYVGTAPIHQAVAAGDYAKRINKPIVLYSYSDAVTKMGYSEDWGNFTLCEAVAAHFLNGVNPIGPIVVVNMANPSVLEATDTIKTVVLTGESGNKVGYIDDAQAAIENVAVTASPSIVQGDYTLEYEGERIKVTIKKAGFTSASCTATYKRIDTSNTAITTTVFATALDSLDLCQTSTGLIPNIVAAPKFSKDKAYHDKMMIKALAKISAKWNFVCASDIPTASVATIDAAITWKEANGYTSKLDKVFYPKVMYDGKQYHLSTMAVVDMQFTDSNAGGTPHISPSNKMIAATANVLHDGTELYIDEPTANRANEKGITTTNIVRGALRLWGGHMANYDYVNVSNINPEDRQDSSIRMMVYMMNALQYDYIDSVDKPMSRRDIDSILASVQQWLNSLVNDGKLLYAAIRFDAASNPDSDIVDGDFVFDVATTTAPNAKSITFRVQYSGAGLSTLTGGEA